MDSKTLAALRKSYERFELSEDAADPDPLKQFALWMHQAADAQLPEPNAMTLATVGAEGRPVELERVVRIEGRVEQVDAAESDAYFASRPLDSRIGAWASPQSEVINSRAVLVANAARYGAQFALHPPRPPHWGGYRLQPDAWEFWQGRKSRLHDRLRYRLDGSNWVRERLAP
jgi:pyridoxamine 5'-phosphate oxidase